MKLSLAFVALAAADSQAPVISLNLDGIKGTHSSFEDRHHEYKDKSPQGDFSKYCKKSQIPDADGDCANKVNSFADECEVTGVDTAGNTQTGSCQEPSASAYDHHDGNISGNIDTVYRLFVKSDPNDDPKKVADGDQKIADAGALAKMVKQRGEWVITYDVQDVAGNDAEQVQFALIMIDTQKPWFINTPTDMAGDNTLAGCDNDTTDCTTDKNYITSNYNGVATDLHIELCGSASDLANGYSMLDRNQKRFKAKDNYDNAETLTEANSIMEFKVDGKTQDSSTYLFDSQKAGIKKEKKYKYTVTSQDFADIFGTENANNQEDEEGKVFMSDTIKPTIVISDGINDNGFYWECGFAHHTTHGIRHNLGYEDCYDNHTGKKNTIKIDISCDPNGKALSKTDTTQDTPSTMNQCLGVSADTKDFQMAGGQTYAHDKNGKNRVKNAEITDTYKVTLKYHVSDKFGNAADPITKTIAVKDTISPTLYITQTKVRTEGYDQHTFNYDGGSVSDYCQKQAELSRPKGCKKDAPCDDYDTRTAHCKQTHAEQHSTHEHKDCSGNHCDGKKNKISYDNNVYGDEVTIQHSAGYAKDYQFVQELMVEGKGYGCYDICSTTTTTTAWVAECDAEVAETNTKTAAAKAAYTGDGEFTDTKEFNMLKPGTYFLKYECSDVAGNKALACRTFVNIDKTRPVITVLAAANHWDGIYYIEASRDKNYVDAGATCSDMVDGNISQDVEVSGDVVNMAAVGTYKINYNCEDSAGQTAIQATRTVVVRDTTCPTCTVPGGTPTITVEASFPYTEAASTCTDTLDGAMPNAVVTGHVDVETTGQYILTYSATDKAGNGDSTRLQACKEVHTALGEDSRWSRGENHFTKTVIVEDTMVPIISLKYRSQQLVGDNLMAESTTTTVNGWVIGAVASAVSGVALLGYAATRKAAVATSVPV